MGREWRWKVILMLCSLAACADTSFEPTDLGLGDADGRGVITAIERDRPAERLDITLDRPIWAFGRDTAYVAHAYDRGLYRWNADRTLTRIAPEALAVGDTVDFWLSLRCCETPAIALLH